MVKTNKNRLTLKYSITTLMFALMIAVMQFKQVHPALEFKWETFKTQLSDVFKDGLGGPGMEGIGIVIIVVGLVTAGVSFVVHKFNPQTRMPGWITCLIISVIGAIVMGGVGDKNKGLMSLVIQAKNTVFTWFGIN